MTIQTANSDIELLYEILDSIKTERNFIHPVEYIEKNRYLPAELTAKPGYVDYNYTPYFKEPLYHLSPLSPVREVALLKSAQIGATTSLLEAIIAYYIGNAPRPMLYVSADNNLVEKSFEIKVERLIDSCGLRPLIGQQSSGKTRRTGDRKVEKEFPGGFLHGVGAQNAGNLRSMSYPVLLLDELDGMPNALGTEGDPVALAKNRCLIPYEDTAKILYLSTPLITQTSKITSVYEDGTQKKYLVPCPKCCELIELVWHMKDHETNTGDEAGVIFRLNELGILEKKSVRYKCQICGGEWENHEKFKILPEGTWQPTAKAKKDRLESYHISALYSLSFSFTGMVESWLQCWDARNNKIRDIEKYRSFRNTMQGLPYEERGQQVSYEKIVSHRRMYAKNNIPNQMCQKDNENNILLLICSVDVQLRSIYVDIKGYTRNGVSYTIDFRHIECDRDETVENINSSPWIKLKELLNEIWLDESGRKYKLQAAFIDSGKYTDTVYRFCNQNSICFAIKGAESIKNANWRLMSRDVVHKAGKQAFEINTGVFKDRITSVLSQITDLDAKEQPEWYMNFPEDMRESYFKMFEDERKMVKRHKTTNQFLGFEWRSSGGDNHAFDTAVYNMCGLEIFAMYSCMYDLGKETLDWSIFWEYAEKGEFYYY